MRNILAPSSLLAVAFTVTCSCCLAYQPQTRPKSLGVRVPVPQDEGQTLSATKPSTFRLAPWRASQRPSIHSVIAASRRQQETTEVKSASPRPSFPLVTAFGVVSILYWYWMVLGSLAASQGWPGIPEFLPLVPGWPPSDADLQPVLDDSQNFFYLSTVLQNPDAPYVQPVRLATFNFAESWIFAFLPLLWADPRRANKWILLVCWSILGINLTNAFLAPYLFLTELKGDTEALADEPQKNPVVSAIFGAIASAVVAFGLVQCATSASPADWSEMIELVKTDRTYTAFAVDLFLFSAFQPILLKRVKKQRDAIDFVPWVGLIAWLFEQGEERA